MSEPTFSSSRSGESDSRLEAKHLAKSYGSRKVVKDVSLSVQKGEVVGLLGPNGAGKTTSFYMIVGLVRSDGGEIFIDGQPVGGMPIHQRSRLGLSYLPQEASIFASSAWKTMCAPCWSCKRTSRAGADATRSKSASPACCRSCASSICASRPRWRCPAVSAVAWKLPAPWPRSRASSCLTSRLPASTRLR
jgi:hypothetical protein